MASGDRRSREDSSEGFAEVQVKDAADLNWEISSRGEEISRLHCILKEKKGVKEEPSVEPFKLC